MSIPAAYRHLIPDTVLASIPSESRAHCSNCSMCNRSSTEPHPAESTRIYFNSSTKCCTYSPTLPNYMLGGILQDETEEGQSGRQRIRRLIGNKLGVFPTGLTSPHPAGEFSNFVGLGLFGRDPSLRCPLYQEESGQCSIWRYREAVCATWYCKHDDGLLGFLYWRALADYLTHTQAVLVHLVLQKLGWCGDDAFSYRRSGPFTMQGRTRKVAQTSSSVSETPLEERMGDAEIYQSVWKEWAGHEEEIYVSSFETMKGLSHKEVREAGGLRHEMLEAILLKIHRDKVAQSVPSKLLFNSKVHAVKQADGRYLVNSYNAYDPLLISADVYDRLRYFIGSKSSADTCDDMERQTGVRFSTDLISMLYMRGILVSE